MSLRTEMDASVPAILDFLAGVLAVKPARTVGELVLLIQQAQRTGFRIIDERQRAEGYVVRMHDGTMGRSTYAVIRRFANGTYLAVEPRHGEETV